MGDELKALGLVPFVKTSGGKGIHVVVPINRRHTWKEVHETSGKIATALAKKFPDTFVASMAKKDRKNRIFVDFHRNTRSATAAAAYSLRARGGPAGLHAAGMGRIGVDRRPRPT